jgi:hypothetical protein
MDHTGHLSDAVRAELHKLSADKQVRILAVADREPRNLTSSNPPRDRPESGLHKSTRRMLEKWYGR